MGTSTRPGSIDPTEWAEYNRYMARSLARILAGADEPKPTMIVNNSDWGARAMTQDEELQLEEIAIQVVELPAAFADLEVCINRAASELEGQGEKSNRIARQLLTALARFHGECGT